MVYVTEKKIKQLSEALQGSFRVTITNDATGEDKSVFGKVITAPVMPEPYGAYYYLLKEQEKVKAQDSILIDIGYGT